MLGHGRRQPGGDREFGLPGDTVEYKNDQLIINGKEYDEPYLDQYKEEVTEGTLTEDFTLMDVIQEEQVPAGHVFRLSGRMRGLLAPDRPAHLMIPVSG